MMWIIRGAVLYTPEELGVRDVLVAGDRVLRIAEPGALQCDAEEIDGRGKLLMPGIVDALTHPCGGGGEGGYGNRTPEISAETFVRAGVTCPVGALGTDSIGRSLDVLYGSVMALRAHGLSAFMYGGAYRVPVPPLTGDIARDLYLVDPVVGFGEVAIADHRGTQPSAAELRRIAAEVQLGGILAGRGGTVLVHTGAGDARLQLLRDAIEGSDLSPALLYPTHMNRSRELLDEAADWNRRGGFVDVTVSTTPELLAEGDITAADALRHLLEAGAEANRITVSSDAGGSLPHYVDGELQGLTAALPYCLAELILDVYRRDRSLFPVVLAAATRNPARALRLGDGLGELREGGRADLLLIDPAADRVASVFAGGRWLLRDGECFVRAPG
jgi:beta-aspartyl-dipeptidase (metallo-type)